MEVAHSIEDFFIPSRLQLLTSPGKLKYKRYVKSPIRYAGGKSLAVGLVVEEIPLGVKKIISPFIGGGSIEVFLARELGLEVIGYDIFDILVNFWNESIKRPDELIAILSKWIPSKENYKEIKSQLKAHWDKSNPILDPTYLAACYWFNHSLSYGPSFLGWMSKIYEDANKYNRLINKISDMNCNTLSVKTGDFKDTIPSHREDFLYCDPPYYLEDGRMFKGIYPQRNFPIHHKGFSHMDLYKLLTKHKGGFVLSYNDCDFIRDLYKDYRIKSVSWQYTMGQGETRIGKNRITNGSNTHIKKSHEILIIGV